MHFASSKFFFLVIFQMINFSFPYILDMVLQEFMRHCNAQELKTWQFPNKMHIAVAFIGPHWPIPNVALHVDRQRTVWQERQQQLHCNGQKGSTHSCGQLNKENTLDEQQQSSRPGSGSGSGQLQKPYRPCCWPTTAIGRRCCWPSAGSWPSWRKQFCARLQTKIAATQETNSKNLLLKSIKELRRTLAKQLALALHASPLHSAAILSSLFFFGQVRLRALYTFLIW